MQGVFRFADSFKKTKLLPIMKKETTVMTDPKEPQEEEIDPSEDRDNDADYYNELESNFNNIWK